MRSYIFIALLCLAAPAAAQSDDERPVPHPVFPPAPFAQAIESGTRTSTGEPGPNYWTNTAEYDLRATLSPDSKMLRGSGHVRYFNQSPDTLELLYVHLRQNIYAEGSVRNTALQVTGGMQLGEVRFEGRPLLETRRDVGYSIENTVMEIRPPVPVEPGADVTLDFTWSFEIRSEGPAPREGTDGEVFYVGYWYPQMAVYDDVWGWDVDPFRQWAEFYMDHADYDVRITVPDDWLVTATGELQNAAMVLTPEVRERLARAAESHDPTSIVSVDERASATNDSEDGTHTWHFRAERVRDFAFGTSDQYVWDATFARTGEGPSMIHAFYRPGTASWNRAAEFGQFAIEFLSDLIIPYPYPHMTSVEGVVGGGMEYPMITIMGGRRTPRSLFGVSVHEISHMWFPMIVGSQETDYSWMDEGLTTFNTREAVDAFWPEEDPWAPTSGYFRLAGSGEEIEVMRHGDLFSSVRTLVTASYDKTGRILHALRGLVGDEAFLQAYREYARRWAFKHPYPYDLFNTFEDVLGEDLDWFWQPLFFETWTLDQAVGAVDLASNTATIEDRSHVPMPVLLRATYADGRTEELTAPVDKWLDGARTMEIELPDGDLRRVEIDPQAYLPDVDRSNNLWTR